MKYVITDYWDLERNHRTYRNMLRTSPKDSRVREVDALRKAIAEAGVVDGDEVEIIVRKTGRRPFGNRKVRYVGPHTYRRERRKVKR